MKTTWEIACWAYGLPFVVVASLIGYTAGVAWWALKTGWESGVRG